MSTIDQIKRIAVFASGSGSNFEAILKYFKQENLLYEPGATGASFQIEVSLLISDKPAAYAIERAKKWGIPTLVLEHKQFPSKVEYEQQLLDKLIENKVDMIILAGYMRLIGPTLLEHYFGRVLNIHPSLLPAFPGKDAVGQAIEKGVRVSGVTIHFVDPGMDTGPIIAQEPVLIDSDETVASLQQKIQVIEHRLYPKIIVECLQGKWRLQEGRVIWNEKTSIN